MKQRTLKDLLSAINIIGEDKDVTVDGMGAIAVCPPVVITQKGLNYFKNALEAPLLKSDNMVVSCSDEKQSEEVWRFLRALAGYCYDELFWEWFEDDDAEEL